MISSELMIASPAPLSPIPSPLATPALFAISEHASRRFWEFFLATIRNPNTRRAYLAATRRFATWCDRHGLALTQLQPMVIAAYIEDLQRTHAPSSVKQHLAALQMLFDWLVIGQVLPVNPAASVRGPKHVVAKGTTPVLSADEARHLLDSMGTGRVKDLRDRALIATMVYTFARVGAVVGMRREDYFQQGRRCWFRLHEKGGQLHDVPAHPQAEACVDAWLEAAGIRSDPKMPLFRTFGRGGEVTTHALHENDVLRMVKRRAVAAGLSTNIGCHTFRATGITAFLSNGGSLERAQAIAAHASPRTTKLYDRTADALTLEDIERIIV